MAITYHAGRRIQGLSTDTFPPADFTEDFSEATPTTWTEDSYGGSYDAHLEPYSGSINRLFFDMDYTSVESTSGTLDLANASLLGSNVSDTKWVMRFRINFSNLSSDGTIWVGLSDNAGASNVAQRFVGCRLKADSGFSCGADNGGAAMTTTNATNGGSTSISTSTDYYVTVERKSETLNTSTIRTGSHTGTVLGTGDDTSISSSQDDLRYWKVMNHLASGGGNVRGYLYDLEIYDGISSVSAVKPTNVQVGSRYEETDTRKMYHYADLTYGGFPKFWAEEGVAIGTYPPTRGVWASGYTNTPSNQPLNTMDYVTLASSGSTNTATDFGDLTGSRASSSGASSYTRGVIAGGSPSIANIEFITIMTKSNASNFGDLTVARENVASLTDRSRGMWIAGGNNNSNVIDYVTISTQANATSFGTLSTARRLAQGVNDATIGLVAGGYISSAVSSVLKFTIQTLGNGTDFGNLSSNRYNVATVSSQTRGIWAGGQAGVNTDMDYRTIAGTSATATVFGSLGTAQTGANGNSDLTKGVIAGGWVTSLMQVMTIDTGSGGATTFGNLSLARDHPAGGLEG